jgi:DNA adenine methylase
MPRRTSQAESDRLATPLPTPLLPIPLLKWAGGKRQLVEVITKSLPDVIDTYYEPFVGGGAIFFALAAERRFRRAVLSDQNSELIETYVAVRDDVDAVLGELSLLPHSEEDYYRIRASAPRKTARRAARMIYLNRTGYNGLYRVNRSGQFNVPFGRYAAPNICDEGRLRAVARALSGVELLVTDFGHVEETARRGDAVYFDPPYAPVSPTARFAEYHHVPFDAEAHARLAELFGQLCRRGVAALLSNSDVRLTRELFGSFVVRRVPARRSINSKADARGPVSEILVSAPARPGLARRSASPLLAQPARRALRVAVGGR